MKPIEPGCLALVLPEAAVGSDKEHHCLIGSTVTVVQLEVVLDGRRFWRVDNEICQKLVHNSSFGEGWVCIVEPALLRIDGHQPDIDDTMQITHQLYSETIL